MKNFFKHKPFNIYNLYNCVKDVFVEPKIHFRFGLWKNDPLLPVWRNGPIIDLYRRFSKNVYNPISTTRIKTHSKGDVLPDGTIVKYDSYKTSFHKIPGGSGPKWTREFRKKLRRWGLGWLPTQIKLPRFFSFHCFNWDVTWKTKYDDYRYEFPPQFTLVFFGLSFSVWLTNPVGESKFDDDYWESILWYSEKRDIYETDKEMGYWHLSNDRKEWRLDERFLKEPYSSSLKQYRLEKNKDSE